MSEDKEKYITLGGDYELPGPKPDIKFIKAEEQTYEQKLKELLEEAEEILYLMDIALGNKNIPTITDTGEINWDV